MSGKAATSAPGNQLAYSRRDQTKLAKQDPEEKAMKDRITIEGRAGAFDAYIARPKALPAPAVVVLHEVFGVNADIRKTCDELAEQGFVAVAPDLFWRQEPGVDLSVTSDADWQHGLRLYQAYDRDAGARDVKDTATSWPNCLSAPARLPSSATASAG